MFYKTDIFPVCTEWPSSSTEETAEEVLIAQTWRAPRISAYMQLIRTQSSGTDNSNSFWEKA